MAGLFSRTFEPSTRRPLFEPLESRQLLSTTSTLSPSDTPIYSQPSLVAPLSVIATAELTSVDIGSSGGSTVVVTPGVSYDITSKGKDIYGTSDSFRFLYRPVSGDFDITVQVSSLTTGNSKYKAGLMARESLNANSRSVFAGVSRGDGYRFTYRESTGANSTNIKSGTTKIPSYLRLTRVGNVFAGYRSSDGNSWTLISKKTLALPTTVQAGMAVAGNSTSPAATGKFRNFNPNANVPVPVAPSITWKSGIDAPYPTLESISIQAGNKFFYMGGYIDSNYTVTNDAYVLDITTNQWTKIANLPLSQTHTGIATDGKSLWIAGGQIGRGGSKNITNKVFRYDIATNKWEDFAPLPAARMAGGLVYVNGALHYMGGNTTDRITNKDDHWAITVDANGKATGTWTPRADMMGVGDHFSILAHNGKIYTVGGEHGHSKDYIQHDFVSEYNPITDTWKALAPIPVASSHKEATTLIVNGKIVAMGGQKADEQVMRDVHLYDFAMNKWSKIGNLPASRKGGAAYYNDGKLYFFAGRGDVNGSRQTVKTSWVGTIVNPW